LEVDLLAPVPVGTFVLVEADVAQVSGRRLRLEAAASDEAGTALARARGTFVEVSS